MKKKDPISAVASILKDLGLNPVEIPNHRFIKADCPKDHSHTIMFERETNRWICMSCKISGEIPELEFHKKQADLEEKQREILLKLDKLNELLYTDYDIKDINESLLADLHGEQMKIIATDILSEKKSFDTEYRKLEQLRLTVMLRGLDRDNRMSDETYSWWINRY